MEVIYLIGVAEAVFLTLLIFNKKNKSNSDFVLAAWLLFIGIELLFYYFVYTKYDLAHPYLLGISEFFPILQGPFMFVYISVLINEKGKFRRSYILHALPFIIISIYAIFDFYSLPRIEKLAYYQEIAESPPVIYAIGQMLNITLGPLYIIWSLIILRNHRKNIASKFSFTESISLNWLKYVILSLGLIWATVIITTILKETNVIPNEFGSELIFISVTVAVFLLGYFGFKQQSIFTDIPLESARIAIKQHTQKEHDQAQKIKVDSFRKHAKRYGKSGLKDEDADLFLNKLLNYMDDEKPYLDNHLSLKQLAELMDLTTNHLSQIINEKLNKNFFDFVNEYRIKEVKQNLSNPKLQHYTLLAIAFQSGFNSKSSFNDIFKKNTGLTPSEYQKNLKS